MTEGIIIKGIGGFYYVDTDAGLVECKARGHFRNVNMSPCVGDRVKITLESEGKGTIDAIFDRTNIFVRPPVSNIDELIIVASACNPSPDLTFIDKMLVIAHYADVSVKICFNKSDLDDGSINDIADIYRKAGYYTFVTSTVENVGIEVICDSVKDKVVAFSGFSGVGKSSLLNSIIGDKLMETGEVSERLRRGKHTTRHVELIKYNNGYIVDTPGFSMLDFPKELTKDMLCDHFPEFLPYESTCKFRDCNHLGTSRVCSVCEAVEKGEISESRYDNYKNFYNILSQRKEWKK